MNLKNTILTSTLVMGTFSMANAQEKTKPEQTEVYTPVPKVVSAKAVLTTPPSDANVLFDGKDLSKWVMTNDRDKPASWKVANGVFTVNKQGGGNIETKQSFLNYQLHIEWQVPANISGKGQGRGNSGLFLASIGKGDDGYELQILDSYQNDTYTNGQAASIYKQFVPLANPTNKPGEWNSYDIVWTAPTFNEDKSVKTPARVTVLFNGILVQDNTILKGPTQYIGDPAYRKAHGASPIKLQSHGDPSEPLSFRNIWIREL
ncbi:3-keto-disaccharide hydrolase [Pedobacter sp. GR22-6]|uniref:3-keto-disaccharide hydrolase n=1 Tax=Pedobacter sp. GR22-6 TaxID=3127957 RepID=UPI00307EF3C2